MPSASIASVLKPATQLFQRLTLVKPKEVKLTVGLDVGSTSVKAVALGARKGEGPRPMIGQSAVPLEPGQEVDASEAVKAAVSALRFPVWSVNLAVSGQWVIMRIVEMPKMKPAELKQALPYEAQRYVPFNVQDVIIDGVVLGPSDANKTWVLIVACKRDLLDRKIDWARRAGVEVALVDVDALALVNGFLATTEGQTVEGTRALINVGSQLTNLVILRGAVPYLVRDIPWGGEKLTRHVGEQLGLEAEAAKKELAQAAVSQELQNALKVSSEALVTELQLSFDYFENRFSQPPEEVLVSGGWSRSSGFLEALKAHLTQHVMPWSPVRELSGEYAVAYGLALRTE